MNKNIRKYLFEQYWQYQNVNFASKNDIRSISLVLFAGKARHNSGNNNILEGNQDMLKERGIH